MNNAFESSFFVGWHKDADLYSLLQRQMSVSLPVYGRTRFENRTHFRAVIHYQSSVTKMNQVTSPQSVKRAKRASLPQCCSTWFWESLEMKDTDTKSQPLPRCSDQTGWMTYEYILKNLMPRSSSAFLLPGVLLSDCVVQQPLQSYTSGKQACRRLDWFASLLMSWHLYKCIAISGEWVGTLSCLRVRLQDRQQKEEKKIYSSKKTSL